VGPGFRRDDVYGDVHRNLKPRRSSQDYGDGAGYDIRSYNDDGTERLIEVKTTAGYVRAPFFISSNELGFSDEHPNEFRLVRVFEFGRQPKAFELAPQLSRALILRPDGFRANPR
jgi:hypothetical protein